MYDLNLAVPNITSQKYSTDNRFLLLKNYLCELNETLSYALGDSVQGEIRILRNEITESEVDAKSQALQLKEQSLKRFNELKEKIIRTADEIQENYSAAIEKNETEILAEVEKTYLTRSEHGEYKNDVNTRFQQTAESIALVSENTDEVVTDLENYKATSRSELTMQAEAIIHQVENNFYSKTQVTELENKISSQITQTENNITDSFSKELSVISEDVSTVGGKVDELVSDLDVYIRRGELEENVYGIEIGRSDSNIKARFTNDRLSFYQGVSEVAYISGSSLYITNADVLDYLRIGNSLNGYFLFDTTSNGLEVRWIGGN